MLGRRAASGREDISRLLDPSYNADCYSAATQRQNGYGAYVDAHGDLHDPDYRQFPMIPKSSQYSAPGVTWVSPDDDDHTNSGDEDPAYNRRNSYSSSLRHSPQKSRQNQYLYASYRSPSPSPRGYTSQGMPLPAGGSPISTFTSSSSSCSIRSQSRSPFDSDDSPRERSKCRVTALKKRRRASAPPTDREQEDERAKLTRPASTISSDDAATEQERAWGQAPSAPTLSLQRNRFADVLEEDEEQGSVEQEPREEPDHVPTCGESLRKQWQAWSLKIRFGLFRAERKLKRRVQSVA